ncbi:hypothetical protein B0H13DRAFT_2228609 [Mycena leptocephala]|nr:hypothetical protein B0H13DRAFT_2228609 [Mycena leptocephala]
MFFLVALPIAAYVTSVAGAVPYYDPRLTGGSMLTFQNEPLNIIVSALSSPEALTDRGLVNFGNALGYGDDCLGIHLGGPQASNLGDGNGLVNQTQMMREDYGSVAIGTCLETLMGGNHYRVFRQNGSLANSGHFSWQDTTVEWVSGLLPPGANGINHSESDTCMTVVNAQWIPLRYFH